MKAPRVRMTLTSSASQARSATSTALCRSCALPAVPPPRVASAAVPAATHASIADRAASPAAQVHRQSPGRAGHSAKQVSQRGSLPRRGRRSHSDAALYILYEQSLMKYTGWCQNDFNVRGYRCPGSCSPSRAALPRALPPSPSPVGVGDTVILTENDSNDSKTVLWKS